MKSPFFVVILLPEDLGNPWSLYMLFKGSWIELEDIKGKEMGWKPGEEAREASTLECMCVCVWRCLGFLYMSVRVCGGGSM